MLIINSAFFSMVRGVTWSVYRSFSYSTTKQQGYNRRRIVIPHDRDPISKFTYAWEWIYDDPSKIQQSQTYTDLRLMWANVLPMQGMFGEFLYQPDDSTNWATTQMTLATPDSNGNVELTHPIAGVAVEGIQELNGVLPTVYFNGVPQGSPTIYGPSTVAPYLGYVIGNASGKVVSVTFP